MYLSDDVHCLICELSSGLTVSASIPAAIISMSLLRSIYGRDVGEMTQQLTGMFIDLKCF